MFLSLDAPLQTRPRTRVLLLPKFELDKEHRGSVAAVQGSRKGALAFVAGSDVGVCPDVPIGFGARSSGKSARENRGSLDWSEVQRRAGSSLAGELGCYGRLHHRILAKVRLTVA